MSGVTMEDSFVLIVCSGLLGVAMIVGFLEYPGVVGII